ncbi:hypothetical protein NJ959_30050, partial [Symplocastrum sp. BBK-W-15]
MSNKEINFNKVNLLADSKSILDHLSIDPSTIKYIKPRWKRTQYRAIVNWLTKYQAYENASNLEKVKGLSEAFYTFCNVEEWTKAVRIVAYRL